MSYHGGVLGKKRDLPILIDVDGVCADFHGAASALLKEIHGIEIDREKIYGDIRNNAGAGWDDQIEGRIRSEGFAQIIPELPAGVEAIRKLMKDNEIMFLTSPYPDSRHWFMDRFLWLRERFGIDRDDIIFARDKRFVNGRIFIDDRWENVCDWSAQNKRPAILFKQPWNSKMIESKQDSQIDKDVYLFSHNNGIANFIATDDWNQIFEIIENQ